MSLLENIIWSDCVVALFPLLRRLFEEKKNFRFIILHHICLRTESCLWTLELHILKHKSPTVLAYTGVIPLCSLISLFFCSSLPCLQLSLIGQCFSTYICSWYWILKTLDYYSPMTAQVENMLSLISCEGWDR